MIIKGYIFSILYALLCLALAFILYKLGVAKKITRKIVHILVGFEWVILYHFFGNGLHFLAVCLLFLFILAVSHRKNLMPMISSDGDNSPGTVYYAAAMSFMALVTFFVPSMIISFGIGVFCTSLGDGFAGLFGQLFSFPKNPKIYGDKTLYGTLFNFQICFVVTGVFNGYFELGMRGWHILVIAFFVTELELFTGRGLDNVTVTLGASFLSYFLINFEVAKNYIVPIILTPFMIAFAYKKRALTVGGIMAAFLVDIIISSAFGNFGFVILLSFYVGSVIVDKIKKQSKKIKQKEIFKIEKRSDCRDHVQVFSNAVVATLCALLYLIFSNRVFIIAFVASIAEAFADTAASGIGVICGKAYDVFRMRKCAPGESGGMSITGTFASIVAAAIISLIALAFEMVVWIEFLIILLSATLGAVFDSFLGSVYQIKFKCKICNSIVEREEHCGEATVNYRGLSFVNNDTVNLLGTLFAAVLGAFLYYILM